MDVDEEEEVGEPKSVIELIGERKREYEKLRQRIAQLSRECVENPQGELRKLRELRQMLSGDALVRRSYLLRKYVVVSLCEIFKDIVPGYKIRAWTEQEREQNVGKDVLALKEYEDGLVKQYKLYIDYLGQSLKAAYNALAPLQRRQQQQQRPHRNNTSAASNAEQRQQIESITGYAVVCVRCASELLDRLAHFNNAHDVIELLVQQLTSRVAEVADLAAEAVRRLFAADKELQLSLDIAQKMAKLLKQKSYGVRPAVLDIFLALRLKEIHVVDDTNGKKGLSHKQKMKISRNDRKKLKEQKQLAKDLEEKRATDRLKDKAKLVSWFGCCC